MKDDVYFDNTGAKKVKSFSADPRKLKLAASIKAIIGKGRAIEQNIESHDAEERKRSITYNLLETAVEIGGEAAFARTVVRQLPDGKYMYDYSVDAKTSKGQAGNKSDVPLEALAGNKSLGDNNTPESDATQEGIMDSLD
ncbi:hypothetical protein, partial [Chelonobacter oris]|uniref:LPD3 domain-containing protein n=1 Tax=Chelonobacter oris TaxID=505317 RepID=UPI00244BCBF7